MSETVENGSSDGGWTLQHDLHEEFRKLCVLSTSGELTAEEWERLNKHLAHCDACRKVKRRYERVVATAIPAMAAECASDLDQECAPGSWSIEEAEATLMESLRGEPAPSGWKSIPQTRPSRWNPLLRYAIAALILVACSVAGYRIGVLRGRGSGVNVTPAASTAQNGQPRPNPSDAATALALENKIAAADGQAAELRNQDRANQLELAKLKVKLSKAEEDLVKRNADLDQSIEDRAELSRELAQAQATAQGLEARLTAIGSQTSQDTAELLGLKTRIQDLNTSLEDKDMEIADQRELLQHDRDIRNVISARNLYIAEIYDVAKSGNTEKPFGRVFYTKGKSLIFYGYDLDQQRGVRKDTAFQAWGSRGTDRQHAVSLGLLYQDDASQKRWALKINDPKTIAEIDAVFVTVEPEGGSAKPTSKPLLFTYLKLDPNHP